ncbi:MAG: peptidoglycan DD-metalloendopeptidase family protein, partial [Alphaproteobacteria bacterium]
MKGEGHFGASRDGGRRKHLGVDLIAAPGTPVSSAISGTVSKIGWTYAGDPHYRYVEVTGTTGLVVRHFYVAPWVQDGEVVETGRTRLGTVQDLTRRYPGIINHLHLEARQADDPARRNH